MVDGTTAFLAIALMAAVTFLTRIGGVDIMSFVPITPRIEAFLRHLAVSVIVALVVPAAVKGGPTAVLAVATAGLVMVLTRSAVGAMLAGVACAALLRALPIPLL
ncbi:MAG: AzlD domain-containing protein [Pseudomonadota bacterium]|jgi:Predicted membrane protein|nr:MAG: branched-chain amino acid transporter [Pseudomonadota bacterium]